MQTSTSFTSYPKQINPVLSKYLCTKMHTRQELGEQAGMGGMARSQCARLLGYHVTKDVCDLLMIKNMLRRLSGGKKTALKLYIESFIHIKTH